MFAPCFRAVAALGLNPAKPRCISDPDDVRVIGARSRWAVIPDNEVTEGHGVLEGVLGGLLEDQAEDEAGPGAL